MKRRALTTIFILAAIAAAIVMVSAAPAPAPVSPGKEAKTVFIDISAFGRKDHAARELTDQHLKMAKEGFTVVNLAPYTENGDLEGFFVTYVK